MAFIADPKGRRALDEILADSKHEAALAKTPWARLVIRGRTCLSLAGAVVRLTWRDVIATAQDDVVGWAAAWVLGFALAAWALWQIQPARLLAPVPAPELVRFERGWMLEWVAARVPLAFFLAAVFARGGAQRPPLLGVALLTSALTIGIYGWALPLAQPSAPDFCCAGEAHWKFHDMWPAEGPTIVALLFRPGWDLLSNLIRVNLTLARGVASVGLILLANQLRQRSPWLRGSGAVVVFVAVTAVGFALGHEHMFGGDVYVPHAERSDFYLALARAWVIPAGLGAAIFVSLRVRRPSHARTRP